MSVIDISGQAEDILTDSNDTFNLDDSTIRLTGGDDTVNFVSGTNNAALVDTGADDDTVNATNARIFLFSAAATIVGENNTAFFVGADDVATLVGADGPLWDRVYGSTGEVNLISGFASVVGGDDVIRLMGTDDELRLLETNGAGDTVYAADQQIFLAGAQANVVGGGNTIVFSDDVDDTVNLLDTGGIVDNVFATGGQIELTGAQASMHGGGFTVILYGSSRSDTLQLYNTKGLIDSVFGTDQTITLIGANAVVHGGGNSITLDPESQLQIDATGENPDTVYGLGIQIDLTHNSQATFQGFRATIDFLGDDDTVTLVKSSTFIAYGASGHINLQGASSLEVIGGNKTVQFTSGDSQIQILYTEGLSDTIIGSNTLNSYSVFHPGIFLDDAQATVIGDDNSVYLDGVCDVTLMGSGATFNRVTVDPSATATINLSNAYADVIGTGSRVQTHIQ